MSATQLLGVFLAAILTENYILCKFFGICPFLGVSKKLDTALGMSAAVTFVMVLATAVTWPIYTYVLLPNGMDYLQTLVFILVIAGLVQLVEISTDCTPLSEFTCRSSRRTAPCSASRCSCSTKARRIPPSGMQRLL